MKKNIIIIGQPRCGKSTLTNMIVEKYSNMKFFETSGNRNAKLEGIMRDIEDELKN